jgi:two-component system response regulator RegA
MMNPQHFLVVDDDPVFSRVLARALTRRGYQVTQASSAEEGAEIAKLQAFDLASIDLKMEGASGLTLIRDLRQQYPDMRILMLTGYASIATAVDAIKLGANQYLPKPADADQILAALFEDRVDPEQDINPEPMSVNRLEWEHIQKTLREHDGNISATARALNMHRRTLQRKLAKYPAKR